MTRTFRYLKNENWYKGNTHIHTNISDGGKSPGEVARLYAGQGYDFLFRTDHWIASNVAAEGNNGSPLLWIDGVELDGCDEAGGYYHILCLGTFEGIERRMGIEHAMGQAREQGGLVLLAHPRWTGNSEAEALRHSFDGVEIYNHVSHWMNGKSDGMTYWDAMLRARPNVLALAADDAHFLPEHPGWNGAWIMVQCQDLCPEGILEAIRAGRYYSTCGPQFHRIEAQENSVQIHCSPVKFIRLVGPATFGIPFGSFNGETLNAQSFDVPKDWEYAYIEIEDHRGRRAWTNTLFVK